MKIEYLRDKVEELKNPHFRTAYCIKPGFKYDALRPYCDDILFLTDGFRTGFHDIGSQIYENIQYFNYKLDCIVPVGTAMANLMLGFVLARLGPTTPIVVAIYQAEIVRHKGYRIPDRYEFYRISLADLLI